MLADGRVDSPQMTGDEDLPLIPANSLPAPRTEPGTHPSRSGPRGGV